MITESEDRQEIIDRRTLPVQIDKAIPWMWGRYIGLDGIGLYVLFASLVNRDTGFAFPSYKAMTEFFELSPNTLSHLNKKLEDYKLIEIERTVRGNRYYINDVPPLPANLREDYEEHKIIRNSAYLNLYLKPVDNSAPPVGSHYPEDNTYPQPVESHYSGDSDYPQAREQIVESHYSEDSAALSPEYHKGALALKCIAPVPAPANAIPSDRRNFASAFALRWQDISIYFCFPDSVSDREMFFYKLLGLYDHKLIDQYIKEFKFRCLSTLIQNPRGWLISALTKKYELLHLERKETLTYV